MTFHRAYLRSVLLLLCVAGGSISAQDYVTVDWVNLRQKPSMTAANLRTLSPGETLFVRTIKPRRGWLPVRTNDAAGLAGWVGKVHVRALHADTSSSGTGVVGGTAGATTTSVDHIDPTWDKPAIVQSTIRINGGTTACGPTGDGVDDGTNLHKNRADVPPSSHVISLDAIRALPDTALWRSNNRRSWTATDSALVLPYEGVAVTVEGYFEIVKPQSGGSGESPNCHGSAELDTDWHIALVASPNEIEEQAVVVEPTPRTKRQNSGWTPAVAEALAVRHSPSDTRHEADAARVRVTGFLMLDPVHPAHIRGNCKSGCATKKFFRATLWEIHPVTKIEVLRNGTWVDLGTSVPPQ